MEEYIICPYNLVKNCEYGDVKLVTGSLCRSETACCQSACKQTQHSRLRRQRQLFASVKQSKGNSYPFPGSEC